MEAFANRVRDKSFLWLFLLVGIGSTSLLVLAPATYHAISSIIGFMAFTFLFIIQVMSGIALDNWWIARIDRETQPFSYWWRVAAWGLGATGFAYLTLFPAAS